MADARVTSIRVRSLTKTFGAGADAVVALDDVSFEASGHVFVSIVGPSGCGKSTLLNVLSGIEAPTRGEVSVSAQGRKARVGYVFQSARLLPWRTVMSNLLFVQKEKSEEARRRCARFLEMVHLDTQGGKFPGQLSGGMQQRVGIARAFSIEPDVLFMDEPFSHLDAITARSLRLELHELWKATKKTVLFVTHDVGEAVELSTRILVFAAGGRLEGDMELDLPFPREASDERVAVTKARILKKFEELSLVAT